MARPRVKSIWSSEAELKAALRDVCLARFRESYQAAWQPRWAERLITEHELERKLDRMVQPAWNRLAAAWTAAHRLLDRLVEEAEYESLAEVASGTRWDPRPEVLEELGLEDRPIARFGRDSVATALFDAIWREPPWTTAHRRVPESFRAYLLQRWAAAGDPNKRQLPREIEALFIHQRELREMPTDSEMAVIGVLCGTFPAITRAAWSKNGISVAQVLDREAKNFRRVRGHVLESETSTVTYDSAMMIKYGVTLIPKLGIDPPSRRGERKRGK